MTFKSSKGLAGCVFTRHTFMLSFALSLTILYPSVLYPSVGLAASLDIDTQTDAQLDNEPTPVQEFAPNEVSPARGKSYDQSVTIRQVDIEGNHLIEADKIKEVMTTRPGSLYSKKNLQRDLRKIYDMGYFTEKIKAVPVATRDGIQLRIEVQENAPVTGVNIQGNEHVSSEELQAVFAGQTGMPQNIGQLNESIEKIEQIYADKGFILARVKNVSDDPDGTINLQVNEGKIAKMNFVGNRKTKDYVIKRLMLTKEGQVYNEKVLTEDLKRVFGTQTFSDVRRVITASTDNPDQYELTVELDEKKTGAISLGGGLDTGTGVFGSVGYNDPNFLGRGQNFHSGLAVGTGTIQRDRNTQASSRTFQFDVGWSTPSLLDTSNALSVNAYGRDVSSFNVPLGIERRIGSELVLSRPLGWANTAGSLALRAENVGLREGGSRKFLRDEFGIDGNERRDQLKGGSFISLSPTIAYDTRNNRLNPNAGWLASFSLTGAYGVGANSYGTVSTSISRYFKIRDGITLALNTQAGHSLLGDIPEFNMFRLGGNQSVRGFQQGGLGIGNGFLMGSAEIRTKVPFLDRVKRFALSDMVSTAFFVDAGTLSGESDFNSIFDRSGAGASIGAGLRLNIPGMGPIRLDYALPILGGGNDDYIRRFSFGVGQKF